MNICILSFKLKYIHKIINICIKFKLICVPNRNIVSYWVNMSFIFHVLCMNISMNIYYIYFWLISDNIFYFENY